MRFGAQKASRVLAALQRTGWSLKSGNGGHINLTKGNLSYSWGYHSNVEIGPRALIKLAKYTGLSPRDL